MDLPTNFAAPFTRWVVASGLLKSRFVLVDVGVQGGPHLRWESLGDMLEVHGFDALIEAIAPLRAKNKPHHHYYELALGSVEGAATLHIGADPCGSSLYDQGDGRPTRDVKVAALDELFRRGIVPPADFIKLDCEGYEPQVLKGAVEAIARSPVLGAEFETNFNTSPILRDTHFWGAYRPFLDRGLLVFDAVFDRYPRPSHPGKSRGRPSTWDFFLARDLLKERTDHGSYATPRAPATADEIMKSAIMFEVYGMVDVAYDTIASFRDSLPIDVGHALSLLSA